MTPLRRMLGLLNAQPLRPDDDGRASYADLVRLYRRYFLARYWPSLLLATLLAGLAAVQPYVHAWSGRVIADDIVQVQLLAADRPAAMALDPTRPGEQRRYAFDPGPDHHALPARLRDRPGRSVHEKLRLLAVLALGLSLFTGAIYLGEFVRAERVIRVGVGAQFLLRRKLHAKMMLLPQAYHDRHSAGELLTPLFSDVSHLQDFGLKLILGMVIDVITMAVGLGIVLSIDRPLAALVLVTLPAYAVCYRWFAGRLRVVSTNLREREGRLNAHIANRLRHFLLVKSFVRENAEALDFLRQSRPLLHDSLATSLLGGGFGAVCGVITGWARPGSATAR